MSYLVSVIVPIYGVEKYIEKCVVSLFEQDFESIEYIFVNDCTPDDSMSILGKLIEKYPNRKPNVTVIHHEKNKGSGAARKTGILNAAGEYTIQIDADDWCKLNMVSSLYYKAKEDNADVVACDFYIANKENNLCSVQKYSCDKKKDLENILNGSLHGAVWNKLIKKSLYFDNNIMPPSEISLLEDKWLTVRLIYFSNKIAYVPKAFLFYRQDNSNSLSKGFNDRKINDLRWYVETTSEFLKYNEIYENYRENFLIGNLYCILSFTRNNEVVKNINYICPESNSIKFLWKNNSVSFSKKIVYSLNFIGLEFLSYYIRTFFVSMK